MPLTFDLPLEALKTYAGTNPRPADFDSYWDSSLAEMRATEAKVELRKADFQTPFAECLDMYFTGVGGARVYAKLLRPTRSDKPHPAVLMFHGYSASTGDWSGMLNYAAMGFTVAAMDCRGQGGRSEDVGGVKGNTFRGQIIRGLSDEPKKLLFRQIFLDTAELARIVMDMPDVDAARVGATGGSQGGGLTLACCSLEPRIKRCAAMFPFLCDYQRVWQMDQDKDAYAELKDYFRNYDPLHRREQEIFTKLGYIDVQHLAPRIKAEVLLAVGLRDTICPPSTQFAAYNKITAPKSLTLYPDFGHEGLPGINDTYFQFLAKL
jgi:cephalosporin-C deacetylase